MPWDEFCSYLAGIMPDTPLGSIVQIRSENDKKVLKNFTKSQKKIRSEWLNKKARNVSQKEAEDAIKGFQEMFKRLAEGGG